VRALEVLNRPRRWAERHPASLSFALACLLRFPGIGAPELSIDETWTWYLTDQVLRTGEFWKKVSMGVDGPLFVTVNVVFAKWFGLAPGVLRAPQAFFGALAVPLAVSVVRRRHAALALPVGLLAAASPFLVFYSKEARPYAQLLFFALLFVSIFEKDRSGCGFRRRGALCLATVLTLTSHYYSIVFFTAFYAVTLSNHAWRSRRDDLRADVRTGALTLLASAPFLLPFLAGAGSVSEAYWRLANLSVAGTVVEQFLFFGTTLPGSGPLPTVLNALFGGLLALPLVHTLWKRTRVGDTEPLFSLWLAAPLIAALASLLGPDLLFYPRGFIPTTPFLFAYWVAFTRAMDVTRRVRRLYVGILLAPFLYNALLVATHHPAHPYFRGRELLVDIARDAGKDAKSYDLVLVDHWWMAQFYYYALPEPEKVRLFGGATPVLGEVKLLPREARLLLVVNDLADAENGVARALASERPLIRERECLYPSLAGTGLVCRRVLLFGPRDR